VTYTRFRDAPSIHTPSIHTPSIHTPRSQAERVEAMRTRLLDATIECLNERGYSAMSTNDVVRRAHVSRGALAHHFPTKADLVRAAAQRLIEQRGAEFRERFRSIEPRLRTPAEALAVLWSFYDDPGAAALIELTVAARHNPELRAVLAAVPDRIAELTSEVFGEFFPDLASLPFVNEALHAVHAMYGGLALNAMAGQDLRRRGAEVRALLNLLVALLPQPAVVTGRHT
jgi:AcrR family transcriptional regulator